MNFDMIGKKYSRLTILDQYYKKDKRGYNRDWCLCQCDCGSKPKEILGINIRRNLTKSCGCYHKEVTIDFNKKYNEYNLDFAFGIGYTNSGIEFYFDKEDYEKINNYCWCYEKSHGVYANGLTDGKHITLAHLVLNRVGDSSIIDHKDRNNRNNQKENLRIATKSQNGMNSKIKSNNKTGFIGIFFNKRFNSYSAYIVIDRKRIYLLTSKDKEEAIIARLKAEKEYFGDFSPQKHLFEQYGII
jgi:hypothetical protein